MKIEGKIVSLFQRRIFPGSLRIENGKIVEIREKEKVPNSFIVPGLIDSHIHVESSLLCPSEFAKIAVSSGCISAILDPHEAANVKGLEGVEFMISNAKDVNFKFYFSAPSCVPATPLEVSGGKIDLADLDYLLRLDSVRSLGEVMDFVSVISGEESIISKINLARSLNRVIDGHAPKLSGEALRKYISYGISTDHEVTSLAEAEEKIKNGMKVIIRCGSASNDFDSLFQLIRLYPESLMLGSDDKSPDELKENYLDRFVRKAMISGISPFDVLRVASLNPKLHYGLDVGQLNLNDSADLLILDELEEFKVREVMINGVTVFRDGKSFIESVPIQHVNNFMAEKVDLADLKVFAAGERMRVIKAYENSLFTDSLFVEPKIKNGEVLAESKDDILKLVLLNRYAKRPKPVVAFVNGFGIKKVALASSILHDSHHIIAVGDDDMMIKDAVDLIIENRGGISLVSMDRSMCLPLPVLGLMSDRDWFYVARVYEEMNGLLRKQGSNFSHPFMALSFLGLPVIPKLKITSYGLFDVETQRFVNLFE